MVATKAKLLVVDDDAGIRRSLARILRMKGYEVEVAADGESAVEMADSFQPDLLILDIRLPGMDGVATFSAIRQSLPSVPAVFMTAYSSSDRARAARELGAISVFSKPLDVPAMVELANRANQAAPVLVVDDDRDLLISLARTLRAQGMAVDTASSVQEAMHRVRQRPDRIVVADVFLNDGFGYDLMNAMARQAGTYSIVLVTGKCEWSTSPPPPRVCDQNVQCLRKPLDIDALVGRIRGLQQSVGGE